MIFNHQSSQYDLNLYLLLLIFQLFGLPKGKKNSIKLVL